MHYAQVWSPPHTQNKFTRVFHEVSADTRGRFHLCQRAGGSGWISGSLFILSIITTVSDITQSCLFDSILHHCLEPSRVKETSALFRGAKQRLHQDISSLHHFMPSIMESIPKSTIITQQILEFIRGMEKSKGASCTDEWSLVKEKKKLTVCIFSCLGFLWANAWGNLLNKFYILNHILV